MNIIKWIVIISSLHILVGCASGQLPRASTEGLVKTSSGHSKSDGIVRKDTDRDGVPDVMDECSGSPRYALVDAAGCEIVTGVMEGLEFGPNETDLSADSRQVLSKLVDGLQRYPDVVFSVEGHTDNRGSAAANLELSKQRVLSVVRYMVSQGISSNRIKPFGYGESRPRAANATAEGREQNRRIEINIVESLL